jgi:hypothetical protein
MHIPGAHPTKVSLLGPRPPLAPPAARAPERAAAAPTPVPQPSLHKRPGALSRVRTVAGWAALAAVTLGLTPACSTTGALLGASPAAAQTAPASAGPRLAPGQSKPLSFRLPTGAHGIAAGSGVEVRDAGRRVAFRFLAPAAVDADGGHDSLGDPHYQKQTSLRWSSPDPKSGRPYVNALTTPYFVLPTSSFRAGVAKPGDLALLRYAGREVYAVLGDFGPNAKTGELSVFAAQQLGIPASPVSGGVAKKAVEYIVLPGSGRGIHGGEPLTHADIQARGKAAFTAAARQGYLLR